MKNFLINATTNKHFNINTTRLTFWNKILFVLLLLFLSCQILAQNMTPIDTISRGNFKILLFEDKTWQYLETVSASLPSSAVDTSAIFAEFWNTNVVYPRKADFARTKDTSIINCTSAVFPYLGKVNSKFGVRSGKIHTGVDISIEEGKNVLAAFDGVVRFAGWNNTGFGNTVVIRHYNGLETLYAHLSAINCKPNQKVKAGEVVGKGGNSGRTSGYHLHFETRFRDNAFDPELIFNTSTGQVLAEMIPLYPHNFNYLKATSNSDYHVVKQGDTLYGLSRKYGVSVKKICNLNGITESAVLRLGQKLRLR